MAPRREPEMFEPTSIDGKLHSQPLVCAIGEFTALLDIFAPSAGCGVLLSPVSLYLFSLRFF